MTEPIIRPARPDDVEAAVPLIFSAGPDAYRYVFTHGTAIDARDFLAHAFVSNGGEFGYPVFWVAELDGEVIATASGYSGTTAQRFMWPALKQIFSCYGLRAGLSVVRRGLQIEKHLVPPKGPGEFYIGNVGVTPSMQGKGIGQRLFDFLHKEGRRQGTSVAVLDVSMENPRAEALYARLGYQTTKEIPSNLRNHNGYVPSHRRMEYRIVKGE